jgi:hypothetical protein
MAMGSLGSCNGCCERSRRAAEHVHDVRFGVVGTCIFRVLRFWVECELPDYRGKNSGRARTDLIAQILRQFEAAGDAMRYLNADGRVAWKATPRMLTRLADAEQEARDGLADWP